MLDTKKFLHVGCGPKYKDRTTPGFASDDWKEVRLDIDESVNPDIISSVLDLSAIDSESFDAIFSSHNIEHVYAHEVPIMLREFLRVLKGGGYFVVNVDLFRIELNEKSQKVLRYGRGKTDSVKQILSGHFINDMSTP